MNMHQLQRPNLDAHPPGRRASSLCALLLLSPALTLAVENRFIDFDQTFDLTRVVRSDATAAVVTNEGNFVLRITTGQEQPWPGVTLPAPEGRWNLSPFAEVLLRVKNVGVSRGTLNCRVDNPGADGTRNCVNGSVSLNPGQSDTLRVMLRRANDDKLGGKLFGLRGYPVSTGGPGTVNASNITQILLFVNHPKEGFSFEVSDIRGGGGYTPPTAWVTDADPFFPFIDSFGQYKHKDWPGKVHSIVELQQRREAEAKELAAHPEPPGWDQYGGWADGPKLQATGFFRTEKVNGKWWLVNPAGNLFWSHGIDCVRMLDATPIEERGNWFENFPGEQADFRDFLTSGYALKGHYAGRSPKSFSFAGANLKRKYGDDWKQQYGETVHQRLRSWGLNTIANWSDAGIFLMRRTPYTDTIGSRGAKVIEGSEGYWGQFPDVFDPSFAAAVRRAMEGKRKSSANDPWCIGYFSDNEMSWGDDTSLALGALKSAPQQAAKREFVGDLTARYTNIARLNTAWGTSYRSWDALLESQSLADPTRARADLIAFSLKSAETYFRNVRNAIKAVAPNQLYLGCRFASVNEQAAKAAAKYCDVVSYNLYQRNIAGFKYPGEDRPLIVGEFHFGALDRGLFHTGLVPVENQTARAQAYRDYVLGALQHPQMVGTHWFQWQDEPTTGRVYDEENYQIGFLDVADTPYAETIAASREVARRLYHER